MRSCISLLLTIYFICSANIIECASDSNNGAPGSTGNSSTTISSSNSERSASPSESPSSGGQATSNGGSNLVGSSTAVPSNPQPSQDVSTSIANKAKIQSALLTDSNGVMVTGPCNEIFQVFFVPNIFINVQTDKNTVEMGNKFKSLSNSITLKTFEYSKNECAGGKTFKFVALIQENKLTLKWKVYDAPNQNKTTGN
ncbi:hypothetical protein PMLGA01_040016300 [Plasmodium malariae]|uniref:Serine repeat antigen 5 n=1 Tax=Plasmodium malariae TaxID=5858 RepID=A0A1C3KAP7_PLAMA|nr:hypothetical protein PMLGA01_040016300 [Plasmodium malariae]